MHLVPLSTSTVDRQSDQLVTSDSSECVRTTSMTYCRRIVLARVECEACDVPCAGGEHAVPGGAGDGADARTRAADLRRVPQVYLPVRRVALLFPFPYRSRAQLLEYSNTRSCATIRGAFLFSCTLVCSQRNRARSACARVRVRVS